jgi:soluble lytic murein transglycosylase-like protein
MGIVIVLMVLGIVLFAVKFGIAAENKVAVGTTKLGLLDTAILKYSRKYGVPIPIIQAVIEIESSYNQFAKNPNDPSYGYMGIMPIVAKDYGIVNDWTRVTTEEINSIYEVDNNIGCGTKLLQHLLSDHNLATAVEMYNVGETGWNKGRRNSNYVSNFFTAYDKYNK